MQFLHVPVLFGPSSQNFSYCFGPGPGTGFAAKRRSYDAPPHACRHAPPQVPTDGLGTQCERTDWELNGEL